MKFIKKITIGILVLSIVVVISACSSVLMKIKQDQTVIHIHYRFLGSTSVGPLAEKLADKYVESNDIKIEVNQIGSSAGITNATSGVSEIGMSSRDLKEEEKANGLKETIVAYDGIVVVTHPE